jgi:F0F1-type ATP synthase assembly protein I
MIAGFIIGFILGVLITLFAAYKPFRDLIVGSISKFIKMATEKPAPKPKQRKRKVIKMKLK